MTFGTWPFGDHDSNPQDLINPATGLPMTGDCYGGVDVGGNPYGFDNNSQSDSWPSTNPE